MLKTIIKQILTVVAMGLLFLSTACLNSQPTGYYAGVGYYNGTAQPGTQSPTNGESTSPGNNEESNVNLPVRGGSDDEDESDTDQPEEENDESDNSDDQADEAEDPSEEEETEDPQEEEESDEQNDEEEAEDPQEEEESGNDNPNPASCEERDSQSSTPRSWPNGPQMQQGDYFPNIVAQSCNGNGTLNLGRDFGFDQGCSGDKPTVIVFTSASCGPCYAGAFQGTSFYRENKDKFNFAIGLLTTSQSRCDSLNSRYSASDIPLFMADRMQFLNAIGYTGMSISGKMVLKLDSDGRYVDFKMGSNTPGNYADILSY